MSASSDWRGALSAAVTDGVALVQLTSVHTLPFSLAQNCTAHHLALPSVAVAWDEPSLKALHHHNVSAILADVFGEWEKLDAPTPGLQLRDHESWRFGRETTKAKRDRQPLGVFGMAGRRLQWLKLYALDRIHALLPGQPVLVADADVLWLRPDAARLLRARCDAGVDAAFMADRPDASYLGCVNGGFLLSCGTPAAARLFRDFAEAVGLAADANSDDEVASVARRVRSFSARLRELYAGAASGLEEFVGRGTAGTPFNDQHLFNYWLATRHAAGAARFEMLNGSHFLNGGTVDRVCAEDIGCPADAAACPDPAGCAARPGAAAQLGDAAALHLNWAATATTKVRMARAAASALDGRGAAALRACLPLLEAAESRRREGHK